MKKTVIKVTLIVLTVLASILAIPIGGPMWVPAAIKLIIRKYPKEGERGGNNNRRN